MKGAGGGMLGKDWNGLVLCGLVGFSRVLGGFGAHAGPCWGVIFHVWFRGHIPQE